LFFESSYNQHVKAGTATTVEKFIKTRKVRWLEILDTYSEVFGLEAMIVRPFEKSQFKNQDLIDDFLSILEINDTSGFKKPLIRKNASIKNNLLKIIKYANESELEIDLNQLKQIIINHVSDPYAANGNTYLSGGQRLEILGRYKQMNEQIAQKYLHRDDGKLFVEPIGQIIDKEPEHDNLTIEETIPLLLKIILSQDSEISEIKEQLNKIKCNIPITNQ